MQQLRSPVRHLSIAIAQNFRRMAHFSFSNAVVTDRQLTAFPKITALFKPLEGGLHNTGHLDTIRDRLRYLLPARAFADFRPEADGATKQRIVERFHRLLPAFGTSELMQTPFNLSLFLMAHSRADAFKFFFDMVSRWLVPGRRLNIVLFYAADFQFLELSDHIYTMMEVMIRVDDPQDLEEIRRNLRIIEPEIRLGAESLYHASRILEVKGLATDEKTALIQEKISMLLKRWPQALDYEVFSEMQHFLVMCPPGFKTVRECRHMSRIIVVHYLFRRDIRRSLEKDAARRYVKIKLLQSRLHSSDQGQRVLSVMAAMNLANDRELFDEQHILKALQHYVPTARLVEGSSFVNYSRLDPVRTFYLEAEKSDGSPFTAAELRQINSRLAGDLKESVEHLLHPIFMPQNEEEVLRHILTLSQQLKYVKDIPQMIISFEEQTGSQLSFLVILLRVLKGTPASVRDLFEAAESKMEFIPDRVKNVGMLRNKYHKEANVFHVRLDKGQFLRSDHSVDLYKARLSVVTELTRILGEVRDFNGGMIAKQNELLTAVKELLGHLNKREEWLLENFFYALSPVVMTALLPPEPLKELFQLFLEVSERRPAQEKECSIFQKNDARYVYVCIAAPDDGCYIYLSEAFQQFNKTGIQLAAFSMQVQEATYLGFLYCCDDAQRQQAFQKCAERSLTTWYHS